MILLCYIASLDSNSLVCRWQLQQKVTNNLNYARFNEIFIIILTLFSRSGRETDQYAALIRRYFPPTHSLSK